MPAGASDKVFGETAVKLGLIGEGQLTECLLIQNTMRNLGVEEELARILEKKKYIGSPQVTAVLKAMGIDTGPIPGYTILSKIGAGGSGVVYKARQGSVDRLVALKILNTQAAADKGFVRRFLYEGRAAAQLSHPHIVSVYDAGVAGPYYYMVMEYIPGRTLRDLLNRVGPLSEKKSVEILLQICEALRYLQEKSLVHRDLKPENVMLTRENVAKLCDFGLAKFVQAEQSLTQSGCIMGTPLYMSPEQIRGDRQVDIRSDLYSLGVTFYTMLCGHPPFEGKSPVDTMQMHLYDPPPDPGRAISPDLWLILQKMLEKDPARRYAGPQALSADLSRFLTGFQAALARHHAAAKEKRLKRLRDYGAGTPRSWARRLIWAILGMGAAGALGYGLAAASGAEPPREDLRAALWRAASEPSAFWEGRIEHDSQNWRPESQRPALPRSEPSDEPGDGAPACRLIFHGPGGSFHRLLRYVPGLDARTDSICFRARTEGGPETILLFVRESSETGTEQFVKEFTAGPEWRECRIALSALRRTWGTPLADGLLQKGAVREIGFEPARADRPVRLRIDAIRQERRVSP
jgi:serine/threonine-protein kinase